MINEDEFAQFKRRKKPTTAGCNKVATRRRRSASISVQNDGKNVQNDKQYCAYCGSRLKS